MKYLVVVGGALWYDFPPLPGHQVQELVHQEGRGERLASVGRNE